MDKILHIAVVLLGVLWLVCDLYALENNDQSNYGEFGFYFNNPYSSNKANAATNGLAKPYNIEDMNPLAKTNAFGQPGENNGSQNQQHAPGNNQMLLGNTSLAELKHLLHFIFSAISSVNTQKEKPGSEYVMPLTIKNGNSTGNQTEKTGVVKINVSNNVKFENFPGENNNEDDEGYEDYYIAENTENPIPIKNNLNETNLNNEPLSPASVVDAFPANTNFSSNRFSRSPNPYNPQIEIDKNETKFDYTFRNIPIESTINEQAVKEPINSNTPPNNGNIMYDTFIPYPLQSYIPENTFPAEYVPAPNQFANSYLVPNQFANTYGNIPPGNQPVVGQPNNPQMPAIVGDNKFFEPYIQYNQRYIPNTPYLSEYIPISPNQAPEINQIPIIASLSSQNLPEPQNSIVNRFRQFKFPSNLETLKTVPSDNSNTNINNYNFQPVSANSRPVPPVPSILYIQNNENSPQKNESNKLPSVPNTDYATPKLGQPPLNPQQQINPLNSSKKAEERSDFVPLNRTTPSNLTENDSKISNEAPKLDNVTISNFTIPTQTPNQIISNTESSLISGENSSPLSDIDPTFKQENMTTPVQVILNQTSDDPINLDNFPKNQSLPLKKNARPLNISRSAVQFNNSEVLLPQNNDTNRYLTTSPQNNVTDIDGINSSGSPKEQQIVTPIPLITETSTFSNTSVSEQTGSPQPDYDEENYDDDAYKEDEYYDENYEEMLTELYDLLALIQDIRTNTTQIPQNTSDSTTSTSVILPTTPSNETTAAPQNVSALYTNLPITGHLNPVNTTETSVKPEETYDSILDYILKFSNNPLFLSLRSPQNNTVQN